MKNSVSFILNYSFLFLLLALIPACDWFNHSAEKKSGLILVNVNDEESYKDARIAGSLNLPYERIIQDPRYLGKATAGWDKNSVIVTYCTNYACTASHDIAQRLRKSGFSNAMVYNGGIQEWYQLSQQDKDTYPFEGTANAHYLKQPIEKIENYDNETALINASDLSKRIKESHK